MAGRNRGTSPYNADSYEDDYSDDFDDDATETGGKRYKTRSPLLRSGEIPRLSVNSDSRMNKRQSVISETGGPVSVRGSKTYRKSKGDMSQASGYMTPDSLRSPDLNKEEFYTPRSRVTADDALMDPIPGKASSLRAASEYMSQSLRPRKHRSYRGRGRGRGRLTGRMSTESRTDNITKRVLSARRLKINELQNNNQESVQVIKDLKEEIKLLKKTQIRQDKALLRFEDRESDLPQLIQRQNNEVRSLRDQIRKWREKYEKTDRYLRDAEDELEKVKIKLKKLKSLADEKDLPERGELNKKLNKQELDLEEKDVKIKELERYIQNLEKNHRHELGIERARQKDIKKQFETLRDENQKLSVTVEEKNKEIQMKNIYANRMSKPPHRLPNSYNGTPQGTPPPRKRRPSLSGADDGITPRERAKQMEQKRREEMRRQRELKQKRSRNSSYVSDQTSPRRSRLPRSPFPNGDSSPARHKPIIRTATRDLSAHSNVEQHDKMKKEQELRKRREQEDREREQWERREQEKELEEKENYLNEQARRDEEERRLREERERLKRESDDRARSERERREREEREKREKKEREDRERKERREREERERRERERLEQERRAQEERRRFEDDISLQAEKKKKEEILQKLREIDEGVQKNRDKAKFNDPFFVTEAKEDSQDSIASSKKSYTFSKPIENMHQGKPARKDAFNGRGSPSKSTSKRRDKDLDGLESGGYNPTFTSKAGGSKGLSLFDDDDAKPAKSNKPAQKSKLMAELFGSSDPPPRQNDLFGNSESKKSNPSSTRPSFLWDDDTPASRKNLGTKRENSATLFGGGSALVNDEDLHKSQQRSNASLSRRHKPTTTAFHSRPTVNAIDDLEDDIEEVML